MAFGTLSGCLPTYRPLWQLVFGRKSSVEASTAEVRPSYEIKITNASTKTSSLHPFARLDESTEGSDRWDLAAPSNVVNHTTITERANCTSAASHLGNNTIKVSTDMKQSST